MGVQVWKLSGNLEVHYSLNDRYLSDKLYDTSGHGRHGFCTAESVPSVINSGLPRKLRGVEFDTENKYLQADNLPLLGNIYSVSWWTYQPEGPVRKPWEYLNGNQIGLIIDTDGALFCGDLENPYCYPNTQEPVYFPSWNEWHHVVQSCDGSFSRLYIDGVLVGQALELRGLTGNSLVLNGPEEYRIGGTRMTDFRIYSIGLDAEQVDELYRIPISVGSNGSLYCSEFLESGSATIRYYKTGVVRASELIESGSGFWMNSKDKTLSIGSVVEY